MKLSRRRFLSITAAFAASPTFATAETWRGTGFGADISITLHGPSELTKPALRMARDLLRQLEQRFSLYDPNSDLSVLNREGVLIDPDAQFVALMRAADEVHDITGGRFDPSVQQLWDAHAKGIEQADIIEWRKVHFDTQAVRLSPGQLLTFNGIAQGYATDSVTAVLKQAGLKSALVNIGEYSALGGPWHLGITDPQHGMLATRKLADGAIATSSTDATLIGQYSHIMHPRFEPLWSTVSVESENATLADGLSTGLVLAPMSLIKSIVASRDDIRRMVLIDFNGDLSTVGAS